MDYRRGLSRVGAIRGERKRHAECARKPAIRAARVQQPGVPRKADARRMRADHRSANAPELPCVVQLRPRRSDRAKLPRRAGLRAGALTEPESDRTEEQASMANPAPGY